MADLPLSERCDPLLSPFTMVTGEWISDLEGISVDRNIRRSLEDMKCKIVCIFILFLCITDSFELNRTMILKLMRE